MKKLILFSVLLFSYSLCFGQWQAGYYQSALPAIGISYSFKGIITPELRIGTDLSFANFAPEINVLANYLRKEDYNLYAGLGIRPAADVYPGVTIPVGIQVFPFERKNFGFHFEATPIIGIDNESILRGALGIRYHF